MMWAKFVGSDAAFYFAHGSYKDTLKSYFYTFTNAMYSIRFHLSFSALTDSTTNIQILIKIQNCYYRFKEGIYFRLEALYSSMTAKDFIRSDFQNGYTNTDTTHCNSVNSSIYKPMLVCFMVPSLFILSIASHCK